MGDKYADKRPVRARQCYRRDNVPKVRYTRQEAREKAAEFPGYHAYRCGDCGHWHTGRGTDSGPRHVGDVLGEWAAANGQNRRVP